MTIIVRIYKSEIALEPYGTDRQVLDYFAPTN